MDITLASGTTHWISESLPATYDEAGFAALDWVQIRGVRMIGEIGQQYETAASNTIGATRPTQERIGLAAAQVQLELYRIADAGQTMLRAAAESTATASRSYKQTQIDGKTMYFSAKVISRMNGGITEGGIADTTITLDIDSEVIEP